ncbi:MAG TPA: Ig-like domain-containing protein, partial [Polyangia bacterium]|nr:Ig-like domain-containing protein [Polyangia bacterium]
ETNVPVDDGGPSQADVLVVVDLAPADGRNDVQTDRPSEGPAPDGNLPGVDLGTPETRPPDLASTPLTVNAGPDKTVCDGWQATIGLPAQGGTRPYTYAWSAAPPCSGCITNPTSAQTDVVPTATTTFTVTAHDSLSAVATDSVIVTVVDAVADAGPDVSVDPGAPVRIGTPARAGYTYAWTCDRPTCALSSATAAQPSVTPRLSTTYTVAVTSPEGCANNDSAIVWVNLPVTTTPKDGEPAYPSATPGPGTSVPPLFVQFGAGVLTSSISTDTVRLRESVSTTPVGFSYSYNLSLRVLTIIPNGANYNATLAKYTLTLIGGASGIVSNDPLRPQLLPADISIRFTLAGTPDSAAPTIVSRTPVATGVAPNTSVVVTFSETLDPASVTAANFSVSAGPTSVAGTLSYDAKTSAIVFVPATLLSTTTTYTARVSGIKDLSGNTVVTTTWTFTTGATADTTPPTVTAVSPAAAATRASAATTVAVTFSEQVDPTALAAGIKMAAGASSVAGSVTYNPATQTATFTPVGLLASQTVYTVTVAGVDDLAGNLMTAAFTSTFTTGNALFVDSFESGLAEWTLTQPFGQPSWGLTTDQSVSASHSLTDSPGGNYLANNTGSAATSASIDVTGVGAVSLSYWLSGQTQAQANTDFLQVQYSANGGSWTTLDTWSGIQNWALHSRTITLNPGTTSLQIRFRFTSNGNQQFDGMYVDDVIVQAL